MTPYKSRISLLNGSQQVFYTTADDGLKAKHLIEAQYCKGAISAIPAPA